MAGDAGDPSVETTPRHRGALALALALALVVGGAVSILTGRVAVASPVRVASDGYLNETVVSPYTFVTERFSDVPVTGTVHLAFFNGDTTDENHTFTLLNWTNRTIPTSYSTPDIGSLIHKYGTLVNVSNPNEGKTVYDNFTAHVAVGYYEFVCMVSGHFNLGMWGYVAFGEALPGNLSVGGGLPGPGLAVFIIVGTIVTLTVLAIVLGFVFGQRRGSEHEMPPERLGYPEPPTSEPIPSGPSRPPNPPT